MTQSLKDWLDSVKPQEGDECEFTLAGKEYRAWLTRSSCGDLRLDTHAGKRLWIYDSTLDFTKLTLLRPQGATTNLPCGYQRTPNCKYREYELIGTWTKPEEKRTSARGEEAYLEAIDQQERRIREIVREELRSQRAIDKLTAPLGPFDTLGKL